MGELKYKYIKVEVDEDDWKELRVLALKEGKTVSRLVHDSIMKEVNRKQKKEK